MVEATELEAHDLAALLCSRVCHDIISPVGAITNGLEQDRWFLFSHIAE